jgi:hypothetical protein
MRRLNPTKAGLAMGAVSGLLHLIWVGLVGGWAKPVMDFVLRLHFIDIHYALAPFGIATGAMLVAVTFAIGFLIGGVFSLVWNWLGAPPPGSAADADGGAAVAWE